MNMRVARHLRELAAVWGLTLILLPVNRKQKLNKPIYVVLTFSASLEAIRCIASPRLSEINRRIKQWTFTEKEQIFWNFFVRLQPGAWERLTSGKTFARAWAMHTYPVAGSENFPRQNLIETIAEPMLHEKKIERQ